MDSQIISLMFHVKDRRREPQKPSCVKMLMYQCMVYREFSSLKFALSCVSELSSRVEAVS